MKKQKPLVRIPMDSTCISLIKYKELNDTINNLSYSHISLNTANKKLNKQVADLEAKVSELEQKNAELENDVKDKGDSVLYWFNKYQALCNERDKEKSDAEAKTT